LAYFHSRYAEVSLRGLGLADWRHTYSEVVTGAAQWHTRCGIWPDEGGKMLLELHLSVNLFPA